MRYIRRYISFLCKFISIKYFKNSLDKICLNAVQLIGVRKTIKSMVDVAQLVRAPVCGTGGRGFESHLPPHLIYIGL